MLSSRYNNIIMYFTILNSVLQKFTIVSLCTSKFNVCENYLEEIHELPYSLPLGVINNNFIVHTRPSKIFIIE